MPITSHEAESQTITLLSSVVSSLISYSKKRVHAAPIVSTSGVCVCHSRTSFWLHSKVPSCFLVAKIPISSQFHSSSCWTFRGTLSFKIGAHDHPLLHSFNTVSRQYILFSRCLSSPSINKISKNNFVTSLFLNLFSIIRENIQPFNEALSR